MSAAATGEPLSVISASNEYGDLKKYKLSDAQWNALTYTCEILLVSRVT